jgi:HSP20 family protein
MAIMASKSMSTSKGTAPEPSRAQHPDVLLHGHDFLDPFAVGSWTPHVDICETDNHVLVRAELPGVDLPDIAVSFQGNKLHLRGIKREPQQSRKLLCFYCLERRYGKFDRYVDIGRIVNTRLARAYLDKGILTIELPKLRDRRGESVEIPIKRK